MDIFILIACVVGFLLILRKDKATAAEADASYRRSAESIDRFIARTSDDDVFWQIQDLLDGRADAESGMWEKIYAEVMAAYDEMGWEHPKNIFRILNKSDVEDFIIRCYNPDYGEDIVRRILLANRGLLYEWDVRSGILFDPNQYRQKKWQHSQYPQVEQGSRRDWYNRQIASDKKLGHYIVRKLREHGIDEPVYFVPERFDPKSSIPHNTRIYRFGSEPSGIVGGRLVFGPALSGWQLRYLAQ